MKRRHLIAGLLMLLPAIGCGVGPMDLDIPIGLPGLPDSQNANPTFPWVSAVGQVTSVSGHPVDSVLVLLERMNLGTLKSPTELRRATTGSDGKFYLGGNVPEAACQVLRLSFEAGATKRAINLGSCKNHSVDITDWPED